MNNAPFISNNPETSPKAPRNDALLRLTVSVFFYRSAGAMLGVALPFWAITYFGFSLATGIALAMRLVPNVLLGVVVGYCVDKWEPRTVALVTGLLQSIMIVLVPFMGSLSHLQILLLLEGVVYMFGFPARMALRPMVIPVGSETAGNSWIITAERLSSVLGPAAAGVLIAALGIQNSFFIPGVLSVIGALLMIGMKKRDWTSSSSPREIPQGELYQMVVSGPKALLQVVYRDKMLRMIVLTSLSYVAAVACGEIFVVALAREIFADIPGASGWIVAAMGFGGVVGALLSGMLGRFHPGRLYFFSNLLEAAVWMSLPWIENFSLFLGVMIIAGVMESVATVVYFSEVQRRLPERITGLFYASFIPLTDSLGVVGVLVAPALLAATDLATGGVAVGVLIAVPVILCGAWLVPARLLPAPFADTQEPSSR
ncbi:MFS transporter [Lysinibacter sp. HNR]|uniref:MFS transporter n=1 Tax=Lysinibacter sp. HNR TaxID=3031408 RepID=UPI0024353D7F|nr:MFS transporter [Lysinibacter sp. HNR]WGD36534.1 MFS transporter [Lysinibacter sp. HNR]